MKILSLLPFCAVLTAVSVARANVEPTPQIVSAAMRDGTTIMDIVYRVDDPDDATVKVRALAFVDGVRSFANVLRPVTFEEGTDTNLGDAIATGTEHSLAWNVGADWEIDLGEVKFEILCQDNRGLLPFEWISIPAAGGEPELTISKNAPTDQEVLDALFWQYADGDGSLTLENGILSGNASSGVFGDLALVSGSSVQTYATPYVFKKMNLDPASEVASAVSARASLENPQGWHAVDRPFAGLSLIVGWGRDRYEQSTQIPDGSTAVTAIASGYGHSLALKSDGTVIAWGLGKAAWGGLHNFRQSIVPPGLSDVIAIAAGYYHSLALKSDGTVIAWGWDHQHGQSTVPEGLSDVTAIAAGYYHSLALKSDGTVIGWGADYQGQSTAPEGLSDVTAIAAGRFLNLALKSDGTVVGSDSVYESTVLEGLSDVTAIAAGDYHGLALKSDGTVIGWGRDDYGQSTVPPGLSDVTAIAAGDYHSLALKSDGTVVAWGRDDYGQSTVPPGLSDVTSIAAGSQDSLAVKAKAQ